MPIYRTQDATKWTQEVLDHSILLPGLEAATGADLLITTLDEPCLSNLSEMNLVMMNALKRLVNHGLLVQVKIGRDFTSSIPDLASILKRMLIWSSRPWLLVIADVKRDMLNQGIIDGQDCGYTWNEIQGAIDWWQLRGGMVNPFPIRKHEILSWCLDWLPRLRKIETEPIKIVTRSVNQFLAACPDGLETLTTFDGIGIERATAMMEQCGTLADALTFLSNPSIKIPGISTKTIASARTRLGLAQDEILVKTIKEEIK